MAREVDILGDGNPMRVQLWRLTVAEFNQLKADVARRGLTVRCVNERCNADMHFKRSHMGSQFAAHNPLSGDSACPNRYGESPEHEHLKEAVAWRFEHLGMRASVETMLGNRKPDVCVFRPDQRNGDAPVFACEIQRSPINAGLLEQRTADLRPLLDPSDRRAAPIWLPTYRPGNADTFAHLQLDEDDMHVVGGLSRFDDHEVGIVATLDAVVEGIVASEVIEVFDRADGWGQWLHRRPSGRQVRRASARRARAQKPGSRSAPCMRNGVIAAYLPCSVCGSSQLHESAGVDWQCVRCRDRQQRPKRAALWHFTIKPSNNLGKADTSWLTELVGPPTNTAPSRLPDISDEDIHRIRKSDAYQRGVGRAAETVKPDDQELKP